MRRLIKDLFSLCILGWLITVSICECIDHGWLESLTGNHFEVAEETFYIILMFAGACIAGILLICMLTNRYSFIRKFKANIKRKAGMTKIKREVFMDLKLFRDGHYEFIDNLSKRIIMATNLEEQDKLWIEYELLCMKLFFIRLSKPKWVEETEDLILVKMVDQAYMTQSMRDLFEGVELSEEENNIYQAFLLLQPDTQSALIKNVYLRLLYFNKKVWKEGYICQK